MRVIFADERGNEGFEGERMTRVEDALVKLCLREGKKGKWRETMEPDIEALLKSQPDCF